MSTPAEAEFPKLLDAALAEVQASMQGLAERYRLYEFHDWALDEKAGELRFGRETRFAAQVIGFRNPETGVFAWGWADASVPEHMLRAVRQACGWGQANGIKLFTEPGVPASEADCWRWTAFAARLANMPGVYAGQSPGPTVFLAFAPLPETA